MATGNSLYAWDALAFRTPDWYWVAFTSGSTEPSVGTTINGDTSAAQAYLEILSLESGTWGGGDAAGYMLLSNWNGSAWTSGENFTGGADTAANHGTLTLTPTACAATPDKINSTHVLDFDDTVNEILLVRGILPSAYDGGGVTLTVKVAGAAATGDMSFDAYIRSYTTDVDNLLHTSFNAWAGPQGNAAVDAPSVVGETVDFTIAFTDGAQMDSLAAGEEFELLLMRDAQDTTNDDMVGDASFVSMEMKET